MVDYNPSSPAGNLPSGDGGGTPATSETPIAAEPGPANPSRAEMRGWYDSPTNAEMVRGEIEPEGRPHGAEADENVSRGGPELSEQIAERVYKDFQSEGVSLDAKGIKELNRLIDRSIRDGHDFDHQSFRDGALQQHLAAMKRYADDVAKHQRKVWDDLNAGWKNDLRKDPELGGNNLQTSLSRAKAVLEEFLSPADTKALLIHTDNNGMGNFPVFIRLLNNIGKKMNVFEDSIVQSNPTGPAPAKGPGNRGWYK